MIPEDIALFHLMYRTSSKGRRDLAEQLLGPSDEIEISDTYTSRVAEIFSVILKSLGLELQFIDNDEELKEYNNSSLGIYELDGKEYFCTEYQFLLIQRKKDLEKEILSKNGIMDADELDELVMKTMKERHYLIGPAKENYETELAFKKDTV